MSSVVEDVRKLLQDLVTPDLKAIEAQLAALKETTDTRFSTMHNQMDTRFSALHTEMDTRFSALHTEMDTRFSALHTETDTRFSAQNAVMLATRDAILAEFKTLSTIVASNHLTILHALDLDRRIERIEKDRPPREIQ